jgi:hypothetical protein
MLTNEMKKLDIKTSKRAEIPRELIKSLRSAGAMVEELDEGMLYSIHKIDYGDKAWCIYRDWAIKVEDDPRIGAGFFPSAAILHSTICPDLALVHLIQVEANSLIVHHSNLRRQDYADGNIPVIGAPIPAPPMVTNVRHATIAVSKMMEAIQVPPVTYPVINGLKSGSYICTVNQQWANAGVLINLFKP